MNIKVNLMEFPHRETTECKQCHKLRWTAPLRGSSQPKADVMAYVDYVV